MDSSIHSSLIIQDVFAGNCVAVVFVVSIILSLVLPKDMDIKKIK